MRTKSLPANRVNTPQNGDRYVPTLQLSEDAGGSPIAYYPTGALSKTVTRDENHDSSSGYDHTTEEFTDKSGRVVLKRTYNQQARHDTYYVYDDYGNLTLVLPPQMEGSTASISTLISQMNDLGYQYLYDHRNRLIEKRVPGREGWDYIIYNERDQPIMTQDPNLKNDQTWLFTKYDALGRVAYTGMVQDSRGRAAIQAAVDGLSTTWEERGSFTHSHTDVGYSNAAYPTTNITEILTVNYYDSYTFPGNGAGSAKTAFGVTSSGQVQGLPTGTKVRVLETDQWITTVTFYDQKARPIYIHSDNAYLATLDEVASELDFTGRPLKVRSSHTRNGNTIVTLDTFTYDHVGRLKKQTQCIGDETLVSVCDTSGQNPGSQDHQSFANQTITSDQVAGSSITLNPGVIVQGTVVLRIDPSLNSGGSPGQREELIVENTYDEHGQRVSKKVGGPASGNGLQTVDYTYNVRGWLTAINDDNPNDHLLTLSTEDLWGFRIQYNDHIDPTKQLFNGNISETLWKSKSMNSTSNPVSERYTYSYDALNRITEALDNTGNYHVSGITYDKNGNILTLDRIGRLSDDPTSSTFGMMDNLTYAYANQSNRLLKVDDRASIDAFGFKDDAVNQALDSADDYGYDENGNLTQDANKGITSISYNHLNLPTGISVSNADHTGSLSYTYDAAGIKHSKILNESGTTTTEYSGNYIYQNGALKFIFHPEGYAIPDGQGAFDYVYQYKDHLGNIRLSYSDGDNDGEITVTANPATTELIEENNYYPFGLEHKGYNGNVSSLGNGTAQKFKFQGQELEEELCKDTYAFQWRDYDPAIGRFGKIDRFAEKYHPVSPYSFAGNNPMVYREIQGDSIDVAQIIQYDTDNGTNILDNIKKDLSTATGLSFDVKNGKLVYSTDGDGNAIIATDGDGNQVGSSEARDIVMGTLGAEEIATAKIVESGGSRVTNDLGENEVGGNNINLDVNLINQFISGAREVDNRTLGFGMTLMHESLHSNVAEGGAQRDFVGQNNIDVFTGPVVDRMNIVRRQLNSQGLNFGIRQTYGARNFTVQGQTTNTIMFGGNIKTVHPRPLTNGGFLGPRIQY